jgi:hypothetical protein
VFTAASLYRVRSGCRNSHHRELAFHWSTPHVIYGGFSFLPQRSSSGFWKHHQAARIVLLDGLIAVNPSIVSWGGHVLGAWLTQDVTCGAGYPETPTDPRHVRRVCAA